MDRLLRPERLDVEYNSPTAVSEWKHWRRTFDNFLSTITGDFDKLTILTNFVTPKVFDTIADCSSYTEAINTLESIYVKPPNEIYGRHCLATRRQQPNETLDDFLLALKSLSQDCNFTAVDATAHREQFIRDAFITGLQSTIIRQRLLENKTLDLSTAIDQARALDSAVVVVVVYLPSYEEMHIT